MHCSPNSSPLFVRSSPQSLSPCSKTSTPSTTPGACRRTWPRRLQQRQRKPRRQLQRQALPDSTLPRRQGWCGLAVTEAEAEAEVVAPGGGCWVAAAAGVSAISFTRARGLRWCRFSRPARGGCWGRQAARQLPPAGCRLRERRRSRSSCEPTHTSTPGARVAQSLCPLLYFVMHHMLLRVWGLSVCLQLQHWLS